MELEGDTLALDNIRQSGVKVTEAIPVSLMDGDPFGANYWRDETYLFKSLLESRKKYKVQVFKKGTDDFSAIDLNDSRLLVMANMPTPNKKFMKEVMTFVRSGGALLVTGGPNMEGEKSTMNYEDLLPVELKPRALSPDQPWKIGLTPQRYVEMNELRKFNLFSADLIERMHEVTAKEGARIMLRANDRYPLLVHQAYGKGQVAFWASSLDRDWCQVELVDYLAIFGVLTEHMIARSSIRPGHSR